MCSQPSAPRTALFLEQRWVRTTVVLGHQGMIMVLTKPDCLHAEGAQWSAGETVRFFIQLREEDSQNTTAVFDDALDISCTSPVAPPNSSFCLEPPAVLMSGPGLYMVLLRVGTIW